VVLPGVFAEAAAGVALAADGEDGAVGAGSLECAARDEEGDFFAGFPEALREFVGEEQGVVAALGGKGLDGLAAGLPGESEARGKPLSELEAVGAGLAKEEFQEFEAGH